MRIYSTFDASCDRWPYPSGLIPTGRSHEMQRKRSGLHERGTINLLEGALQNLVITFEILLHRLLQPRPSAPVWGQF